MRIGRREREGAGGGKPPRAPRLVKARELAERAAARARSAMEMQSRLRERAARAARAPRDAGEARAMFRAIFGETA